MQKIRQRRYVGICAVLLAGWLTTAGQAFEPAVEVDWGQPAEEVCTGKKLGTAITLYDKPEVAVRIAREQGKLVYVIQVSGNFSREEFT